VTAILASLMLAAGAEPDPRRCQIDVCVTQTDPAAPRSEQREKVLAEPRVVTQFGRPAFFRAGKTQNDTDGIRGPGNATLVSGFELEVLPLQKADGRIRLEVRVTPVGAERGSNVVGDLKPGKKLRFDGPEGRRIEVSATEVAAEK
jgi:hypothetical protein